MAFTTVPSVSATLNDSDLDAVSGGMKIDSSDRRSTNTRDLGDRSPERARKAREERAQNSMDFMGFGNFGA